MRLAVELKSLRLIDHIIPIFIGYFDSENDKYRDYFKHHKHDPLPTPPHPAPETIPKVRTPFLTTNHMYPPSCRG